MGVTEEKFVASGEVRLWAERSGSPGDPAVLLIMGTSAQGIGFFSPGLPRHIGQLILGHAQSPPAGT